MRMSENVVEMHDIVKTFGHVKAVQDGQFELRQGEIHSLIGENGAGKSTMMKLLYGMYPINSGSIEVKGKHMENMTPKAAIQNGIGMVHQEFMLVGGLTVLENIILGFEPVKGMRLDLASAGKEVMKYIEKYGMDVPLDRKVNQISVGEAQRVEIIKTLMRGADTIILDEPTAVLTPQETESLFRILRNLKESGRSIVFISHKLNEVMEISDRITVMRQGKYMGTINKSETSPVELTKMMIGREVFLNVDKDYGKAGEVILDVQNIWVPSQKETSKIRDMSFQVRAGEIVGVAGIDGNGQSELVEAITGLRKVEKGRIIHCGRDVTNLKPKNIRASGFSHIPEDRNKRGLNRTMTIRDNLISVQIDTDRFAKHGVINRKAEDEYAREIIREFDIRPADEKIPASSLSGGNAQKVVVAREVSQGNKLLIASQPTRGVDIGAIETIRNTIEKAKKQGCGVLLVSAELEEIMSLSDRIIVIHEGKITGSMRADEANESTLGLLMMGGSDKKEVRQNAGN